jgi:membrane-associated phospholipid phosphatase
LKQFLKNNALLLGTYAAVVCLCLFLIYSNEKTALHRSINNSVGNPVADTFFYYITWLGDGTMAIFMLAAILIVNVRLGIYATATFLVASLTSIGLKELFFDDENRPFFIFTYYLHEKLKLVDGVDIHIHNSFPSGHATQAFAILMCLAFVAGRDYFKLFFLLLALLTSFSRVYLSQHWLVDVTVGSFIGTLFSAFFYFLFIGNHKFDRLNKAIFVFIRFWRSR